MGTIKNLLKLHSLSKIYNSSTLKEARFINRDAPERNERVSEAAESAEDALERMGMEAAEDLTESPINPRIEALNSLSPRNKRRNAEKVKSILEDENLLTNITAAEFKILLPIVIGAVQQENFNPTVYAIFRDTLREKLVGENKITFTNPVWSDTTINDITALFFADSKALKEIGSDILTLQPEQAVFLAKHILFNAQNPQKVLEDINTELERTDKASILASTVGGDIPILLSLNFIQISDLSNEQKISVLNQYRKYSEDSLEGSQNQDLLKRADNMADDIFKELLNSSSDSNRNQLTQYLTENFSTFSAEEIKNFSNKLDITKVNDSLLVHEFLQALLFHDEIDDLKDLYDNMISYCFTNTEIRNSLLNYTQSILKEIITIQYSNDHSDITVAVSRIGEDQTRTYSMDEALFNNLITLTTIPGTDLESGVYAALRYANEVKPEDQQAYTEIAARNDIDVPEETLNNEKVHYLDSYSYTRNENGEAVAVAETSQVDRLREGAQNLVAGAAETLESFTDNFTTPENADQAAEATETAEYTPTALTPLPEYLKDAEEGINLDRLNENVPLHRDIANAVNNDSLNQLRLHAEAPILQLLTQPPFNQRGAEGQSLAYLNTILNQRYGDDTQTSISYMFSYAKPNEYRMKSFAGSNLQEKYQTLSKHIYMLDQKESLTNTDREIRERYAKELNSLVEEINNVNSLIALLSTTGAETENLNVDEVSGRHYLLNYSQPTTFTNIEASPSGQLEFALHHLHPGMSNERVGELADVSVSIKSEVYDQIIENYKTFVPRVGDNAPTNFQVMSALAQAFPIEELIQGGHLKTIDGNLSRLCFDSVPPSLNQTVDNASSGTRFFYENLGSFTNQSFMFDEDGDPLPQYEAEYEAFEEEFTGGNTILNDISDSELRRRFRERYISQNLEGVSESQEAMEEKLYRLMEQAFNAAKLGADSGFWVSDTNYVSHTFTLRDVERTVDTGLTSRLMTPRAAAQAILQKPEVEFIFSDGRRETFNIYKIENGSKVFNEAGIKGFLNALITEGAAMMQSLEFQEDRVGINLNDVDELRPNRQAGMENFLRSDFSEEKWDALENSAMMEEFLSGNPYNIPVDQVGEKVHALFKGRTEENITPQLVLTEFLPAGYLENATRRLNNLYDQALAQDVNIIDFYNKESSIFVQYEGGYKPRIETYEDLIELQEVLSTALKGAEIYMKDQVKEIQSAKNDAIEAQRDIDELQREADQKYLNADSEAEKREIRAELERDIAEKKGIIDQVRTDIQAIERELEPLQATYALVAEMNNINARTLKAPAEVITRINHLTDNSLETDISRMLIPVDESLYTLDFDEYKDSMEAIGYGLARDYIREKAEQEIQIRERVDSNERLYDYPENMAPEMVNAIERALDSVPPEKKAKYKSEIILALGVATKNRSFDAVGGVIPIKLDEENTLLLGAKIDREANPGLVLGSDHRNVGAVDRLSTGGTIDVTGFSLGVAIVPSESARARISAGLSGGWVPINFGINVDQQFEVGEGFDMNVLVGMGLLGGVIPTATVGASLRYSEAEDYLDTARRIAEHDAIKIEEIDAMTDVNAKVEAILESPAFDKASFEQFKPSPNGFTEAEYNSFVIAAYEEYKVAIENQTEDQMSWMRKFPISAIGAGVTVGLPPLPAIPFAGIELNFGWITGTTLLVNRDVRGGARNAESLIHEESAEKVASLIERSNSSGQELISFSSGRVFRDSEGNLRLRADQTQYDALTSIEETDRERSNLDLQSSGLFIENPSNTGGRAELSIVPGLRRNSDVKIVVDDNIDANIAFENGRIILPNNWQDQKFIIVAENYQKSAAETTDGATNERIIYITTQEAINERGGSFDAVAITNDANTMAVSRWSNREGRGSALTLVPGLAQNVNTERLIQLGENTDSATRSSFENAVTRRGNMTEAEYQRLQADIEEMKKLNMDERDIQRQMRESVFNGFEENEAREGLPYQIADKMMAELIAADGGSTGLDITDYASVIERANQIYKRLQEGGVTEKRSLNDVEASQLYTFISNEYFASIWSQENVDGLRRQFTRHNNFLKEKYTSIYQARIQTLNANGESISSSATDMANLMVQINQEKFEAAMTRMDGILAANPEISLYDALSQLGENNYTPLNQLEAGTEFSTASTLRATKEGVFVNILSPDVIMPGVDSIGIIGEITNLDDFTASHPEKANLIADLKKVMMEQISPVPKMTDVESFHSSLAVKLRTFPATRILLGPEKYAKLLDFYNLENKTQQETVLSNPSHPLHSAVKEFQEFAARVRNASLTSTLADNRIELGNGMIMDVMSSCTLGSFAVCSNMAPMCKEEFTISVPAETGGGMRVVESTVREFIDHDLTSESFKILLGWMGRFDAEEPPPTGDKKPEQGAAESATESPAQASTETPTANSGEPVPTGENRNQATTGTAGTGGRARPGSRPINN